MPQFTPAKQPLNQTEGLSLYFFEKLSKMLMCILKIIQAPQWGRAAFKSALFFATMPTQGDSEKTPLLPRTVGPSQAVNTSQPTKPDSRGGKPAPQRQFLKDEQKELQISEMEELGNGYTRRLGDLAIHPRYSKEILERDETITEPNGMTLSLSEFHSQRGKEIEDLISRMYLVFYALGEYVIRGNASWAFQNPGVEWSMVEESAALVDSLIQIEEDMKKLDFFLSDRKVVQDYIARYRKEYAQHMLQDSGGKPIEFIASHAAVPDRVMGYMLNTFPTHKAIRHLLDPYRSRRYSKKLKSVMLGGGILLCTVGLAIPFLEIPLGIAIMTGSVLGVTLLFCFSFFVQQVRDSQHKSCSKETRIMISSNAKAQMQQPTISSGVSSAVVFARKKPTEDMDPKVLDRKIKELKYSWFDQEESGSQGKSSPREGLEGDDRSIEGEELGTSPHNKTVAIPLPNARAKPNQGQSEIQGLAPPESGRAAGRRLGIAHHAQGGGSQPAYPHQQPPQLQKHLR